MLNNSNNPPTRLQVKPIITRPKIGYPLPKIAKKERIPLFPVIARSPNLGKWLTVANIAKTDPINTIGLAKLNNKDNNSDFSRLNTG
jgi:hypothetical protein